MIGKSVGSIVSAKQIQELIAVPASVMVSEAVSKMSEKGVGAILIKNSQNTVDGIFTERDLMIRVVNAGRDAKTTAIGMVMTSQVGRVEGWTGIEDALSYLHYPQPHRVRISSTNPVERLNLEIRRRTRVVGIFPHAGACLRLIGMVLVEKHEDWLTDDKVYLSFDDSPVEEPAAKLVTMAVGQ